MAAHLAPFVTAHSPIAAVDPAEPAELWDAAQGLGLLAGAPTGLALSEPYAPERLDPLDGLDGRLARMLKSESAIGAELDSLCDFVNFGVVPGLVLYLWGLRSETNMGWIAVLVYAVCCMLRLARFNVGSREAVPAEKTVFIGVPAPAGAMLALLPIYLSHVASFHLPAPVVALWMVSVGALMISHVRTPSLKRVTIPASLSRFALVGAVAVVASLITYPWATLLMLSLAYLAAILILALSALRKPA